MEQTDAELDYSAADFHPQIDQPEMAALHGDEAPETPVELSSHCDNAEYAESLRISPDTVDPHLSTSCDVAPLSEPAGEVVLSEELSASMALDFESVVSVDDTVVAAMVEAGDTSDVAVDENSTMTVEVVDNGPVKRKRGRPRKNPEVKAAPPVRKKEREDVCFVCFDRRDPNLVACNRRGCYKAYHPTCVNRDDAFFRSKGKWNCGCHICSTCQKAAQYICYTCTTSYCKECIIDERKYVCVRGTYGFCQSCHNTVTLIELNKLAFEKQDCLDFDDADSFTYLFKAYWLDRKEKLSLTSEELNNAKHPYSVAPDDDSSDELYDVNEDKGSSSESSSDHKSIVSSKKKVRGRSQAFAVDKNPAKEVDAGGTIMLQETGWASMELLELVTHMRNGDQSSISQFDVQALLLDYIKKYNLRDPRRKSQIICDLRLRKLFGKERVGHFEMLKLLESHFLSKEVPQVVVDGNQMETSDTDHKLTDDVEEGDTFARVVSEKRRKNRKRTEEIESQMNVDDYAAIDIHNITLIFLRRSLLEDLLDDIETFNDKVVGSFVRIRISIAGQRQDLYRLVQIIGTLENSKPYKVGKKTTDIVLEILNLNKKETSTIDSISNQDFTEEECQRLRQSIKCGLIDRLKVGYVQEKAKVLHGVRVNDSIETEKLRLSHLRDRASETGRRKELRECVEKLQLLNNPDERRRRLNELPQINVDPKMDPEYESSEEEEDDRNQDYPPRSKEVVSLGKRRELIPRGRAGTIGNNWNGMLRSPNSNRESNRRMQGEVWQDRSDMHTNMVERPNEVLVNQSKELHQTDAFFSGFQTPPSPGPYAPKSLGQQPHGSAPEINSATPEASLPSITNEADKIWRYQDPSMNIQGPFSLSQLRKWNTTGYFPPDMRIWRASEKQEDSKLLADVLAGRFYIDPHQPTWAERHQTRPNLNPHQNIKQTAFDALPLPSPLWPNLAGVHASNSSEGKPAGPIYNNPYQDAGRGGNVGGLDREQDYGNIWSPTGPKVEDNHTLNPSIAAAIPSANELNGRMSKYQSYESDCPSPTPMTERKDSFLRPVAAPLSPGNGMLRADDTKSASSEFQNDLSPIAAAPNDVGRKIETGFQAMDHTSVQKRFTVGSLAPSHGMEHDQSQNHTPNYSPIVQVNRQNARESESSLPSPTPKSTNNIWGIDASSTSSTNLSTQNHANWGGAPQGNAGWAAPAYAGWAAPVPANPNANIGWGLPVQLNANANAGWGTVPQRNGSWKSSDRDASRHFDHEGRNGDGYPRHRDRDMGHRNGRLMSGGRGGSAWSHQASAGGDGQRGVCKFFESGHCKKGRSCKYLHNDPRRDI